ncbi:hypothetical protein DFO70_103430 [Cytobacillus firmus]|uniref:Uncharacterized protein n=2 Tax=Cytobacillus TaxID=2675230 RepID=A0A366K2K6_CYTFI|nr:MULTISPECIES: hypothetical protein [Cytobacillus]RBP95388.1 hypothetical protein DFO70_103430 [Cytobacillus firmus]TDX44229.1 hypothetical protein DFO72_104443 [Cytobacillus oceanisediminis]
MGDNVQKYKDMEKRLTLMRDKDWLNAINSLKSLIIEEDKEYSVTYRENRQRNNRTFGFHKVKFVEDTQSFIFTSFVSDWESGELTNEVRDKITLKDIDIIKYTVRDKPDLDGLVF